MISPTVLIFTFYTDLCFFFVDSLIRYCFSAWGRFWLHTMWAAKTKKHLGFGYDLFSQCLCIVWVSTSFTKNTAAAFLTLTAVRKGLWKGVVAVIEAPITAGISVKGSATIPSANKEPAEYLILQVNEGRIHTPHPPHPGSSHCKAPFVLCGWCNQYGTAWYPIISRCS